jgi:hypothetical protein
MNSEPSEPAGTNGVPSPVDPDPFPGVSGAERPSDAPESILERSTANVQLNTKKKKGHKKTGFPVGRPTKAVVAERKRLADERALEQRTRGYGTKVPPKLGPEAPRGLGWGGARKGAGRHRITGPKKKSTPMAIVRIKGEFGETLKAMPQGDRSEYLRQAVDLMKDIMPPEKFLASGKKKKDTDPR